MKRIKRIMLHVLLVLSGSLLLLFLSLLICSPGKPGPFLDEEGIISDQSISEKIYLEIGGIKQGMFIKSKDLNNPVLLYLHGGIPDYFLERKSPSGLEDYFTVVWWEQRGFGLSYDRNNSLETINLNRMIADTKELTQYLCHRFHREKVFLMGRSGGTFIGMHTAAEAPELYHAYIAVGQITDQLRSEKLAHEYMLKEYGKAGKRRMLHKLEAAAFTDTIPPGYLKLRDPAMHRLGIGTTHRMRSVVSGLFIPSLTCRDYTLNEKISLWQGKARTGVHPLWDTMVSSNLAEELDDIQIPVYFLHGIYDYTVSYDLSRDYFIVLRAPLKGFYTFRQSAHSPIFEEPQRLREIVTNDILNGKIELAD